MSGGAVAHADLRALNTLRLPARARWFCGIDSREELAAALEHARGHRMRTLVLGGGSNVVLRGEIDGLVLHMRMAGQELLDDSGGRVVVRVAAGEPWHGFVLGCHARGWYGLENLALIPGTVGAAPIQNIGAYGVELARFVREVAVVERANGRERCIGAPACEFRYRDSVFKHAAAEQLVITSVTFELPRGKAPCTAYAALAADLPDRENATHAELLAAVIRLRTRRLPDPAVLPNAGSFFKNPVIPRAAFDALLAREPEVAHWSQPDGSVKLAAAWLVDRAGWKGHRNGDAGVHDAQALVLVNHASASADDILGLACRIADSVHAHFGVALELEPVVY